MPIEARKQWAPGALTAYDFSGNIKPGLIAKEGRALCMWGDPGWGVAYGKKGVRAGRNLEGKAVGKD